MKRRALLLALAVAAVLAAWQSFRSLEPKIDQTPRALFAAVWGMSPEEVAAANGAALEPSSSGRRFHTIPPGSEARYKTLEARNHRFFGSEAVISYTFVDDKLFTYHVFISGADPEAMDTRIVRYLEGRYGPGSPVEDGSKLKHVWQKKDITVNYWAYEDEMSLVNRFKTAFGVVYKPLERASSVN